MIVIFCCVCRSLLYRPLPIDIGRCTCVIVKEASPESRDGGSFYSLYTNVRLLSLLLLSLLKTSSNKHFLLVNALVVVRGEAKDSNFMDSEF